MILQDIVLKYPYYELGADGAIQIRKSAIDFLAQLFSQQSQVKYARITPMNIVTGEEGELIGKITQGSINLDGKSAVRRSCNLTLVTDDVKGTITNASWALKTKFQLDIGIASFGDLWIEDKLFYEAGDIVWFPAGEFAIQSFNASLNVNSYTITISGQDKMTLLNGTLGGTFPMQINLSSYDQLNERGEVISTQQVPLEEIIVNLLLVYGEEDPDNIIIKDLQNETASNLLEYRGSSPLYILLSFDEQLKKITVKTITTYGNQIVYDANNGVKMAIKSLPEYYYNQNQTGKSIKLSPEGSAVYYCRKVEYGQTVGYEPTGLIYPGELIGEVGTTITAALDKIKNIYANYEYFYDQFGRFIWQKRPNAYIVSYPEINNQGRLEIKLSNDLQPAWIFKDLELHTTISNNSVIQEVKNDFTVWGKKKSTAGELPIHMRVAIQKKPVYYKSVCTGIEYTVNDYDWREIIYQMAKDQNDYRNQNKEFNIKNWQEKVAEQNPTYYPTGKTGFEDYYLDMLTFWRTLYDPDGGVVKYEPTTGNDNSHGQLYLPYRYNIVYNPDEIDNVSCADWYSQQYIDSEQNRIYYRWVDALDVEGYFTETYPESSIYGLYNNTIQDLEELASLESGNVYSYNNITQSWQDDPWSLFISHRVEPDKITAVSDGISVNECYENCYYANKDNLKNKQRILACADVRYIRGQKDYFNLSGIYGQGRYDLSTYGFDTPNGKESFRVPEEERSKLVLDENNWTIWFKDEKLQINDFRRAIAIKIQDAFYTQSDNINSVINALRNALKDEKAVTVYGLSSENFIGKFELTSTAALWVYYYTKTLNENDVLYYKNGNIFSLLADHEIVKRDHRRLWHFKNIDTTIRDFKDGDAPSFTKSEDNRTITVVTINDGKTVTKVTKYIPILSKLDIDKSKLYYESQDSYQLIDYKTAYLQASGQTDFLIREEGIFAAPDPSSNLIEGVANINGSYPIYKDTYTFDWLGNKSVTRIAQIYYYSKSDFNNSGDYWNERLLTKEPYNRLFWLEFINPEEGLNETGEKPWYAQFSKDEIGKRPKAATDSAVTAINYLNTPQIEFNTEEYPLSDNFRRYFVVSAQGKTAQEAIDDWLSKYTFCAESVSTNIIPVYILEPNQIIQINDPNISGIVSNYSINSMSIPLAHNGTMSLNLTKIFEYKS